jgi:thiol-disulfide isomerase/thioredoxin
VGNGSRERRVRDPGCGPYLRSQPAQFQRQRPERENLDLADLKGKATLIDVWATWSGACRAEHPLLQELYSRIRDRKDMQILTFSVDENSYLPAAYVKEQEYAFPVIVSKDLGDRLFPMPGLPQRWVVDARARRSSPFLVHPSDFDRVIAELEKAASAK